MITTVAAFAAILCFSLTDSRSLKSEECRISLPGGLHPSNPPMLISPAEQPSYAYAAPDDPTAIVVGAGEALAIGCPQKTNRASTKSTGAGHLQLYGEELSPARGAGGLVCSAGGFVLDGRPVRLANVSCAEAARASYSPILREAEAGCLNGARYEIGYELEDGRFLRTLELCHDAEGARTLWAHDVVQPVNTVATRFKADGRKSFKAGSLYKGISMSKELPYNLDRAFRTLTEILKSETKASKYLSPRVADRKFFAKGHLIADADKIYKSEKDSTYFYANAVPMWQQINAQPGNWYFVEEYVRKLAVARGHALDVWAGGLGVAELEGRPVHLVSGPRPRLPVPRVLFKCALDRADGEAVCFLVVNNPYVAREAIERPKSGYLACERSAACDGLTASRGNAELGYLYCCGLRDFVARNKRELGLEDLQEFLDYGTMRLEPLK